MVAKSKKISKLVIAKKGVAKTGEAPKKVRVGIVVGKDFDPVKKNTQWPTFPKHLSLTGDDWGKFSIDAATALRMQNLHPDLLDIDIIPGKQLNKKRLQKNLVNLIWWYDAGCALMDGNKRHHEHIKECQKDPALAMDPCWDYYDWIVYKPRYLKALERAGVPIIPTVIYEDGFDPTRCLRDVQKKGWEKFFVKVGHFAFFGEGATHGKTEDFLGKRAKDLEKFAAKNKASKCFLVQPYMLKPDGQVFDEVRNFYIDGEWRYSIFTHGTDGSDAGFYEEPLGPRKAACKALADRAFQEVLKVASFNGKKQTPLLNRIDIGVIPKKGADSLHRTDNTYFVNEIENQITTWLDRYAPISVSDVMTQAAMKHTLELLVGLLNSKRKIPDASNVRKVVKVLNDRLGPFKHLKI